MWNAPHKARIVDRLLSLVGYGRGYSEEDVADPAVGHPTPATWHYANGRVVRDGPDVEALAREVRDLIQTATDLSRDLAKLSQEMSALKRRRARRASPFPSPARSRAKGKNPEPVRLTVP